jgi:hypothetical protein
MTIVNTTPEIVAGKKLLADKFENGGWIEQVENDTLCKQSAFTTKLTYNWCKDLKSHYSMTQLN